MKKIRQTKEEKAKHKAKYYAEHKEEISKNRAKYYAEHKEKYAKYRDKHKERNAKYRVEHREYKAEYRACKEYNITPEEYQRLLTIKSCMICGDIENTNKLHIDHDHNTGKIRGKLCSNCNNGLGRFKDNPELLQKAIDYLTNLKCIP